MQIQMMQQTVKLSRKAESTFSRSIFDGCRGLDFTRLQLEEKAKKLSGGTNGFLMMMTMLKAVCQCSLLIRGGIVRGNTWKIAKMTF